MGLFRVICPKCHQKLYEGEEEKPIKIILRGLDYRCPHCGAKLSPQEVKLYRVVPK